MAGTLGERNHSLGGPGVRRNRLTIGPGMTSSLHSGDRETTVSGEWQVVVVYDDGHSRARALQLVHSMERQFKGDLAFSCSWWRFRFLNDPAIALVARHYACAADIIIFASSTTGLFPLPVMNWIESWASSRRKGAGLLVPLIGSPHIPTQLYSTKHFYLRHVAERSRMDYLPPLKSDPVSRPLPRETPSGIAARPASPQPLPS
jgi:hypothetical protein